MNEFLVITVGLPFQINACYSAGDHTNERGGCKPMHNDKEIKIVVTFLAWTDYLTRSEMQRAK